MRCLISIGSRWMHSSHKGLKHLIQASLLVGLLLATLPALAETGQISGVAKDPHGAVVIGAEVQVINQDTAATTKVTTDNTGTYSAHNLQPGRYQVTVNAKGFGLAKSADIILADGQALVHDVQLAVGASRSTVNVNAQEAIVNPEIAV